MFAAFERMPIGPNLRPDLQLLGRAVHHPGDDIDADVKCHAGDGIRLGALKRRWPAMRDSEGEYCTLAGHLPPFDVASPAGENAHRPWKVLIFLCRLAVLDNELLLPCSFPERHTEIVMLDVELDRDRVVECDINTGHSLFGSRSIAVLVSTL